MRTRVSIAMATYNGEKYIKEQIDSILINMKDNDELIISDDGSTDKTTCIIKKYNDKRIKLFKGPQSGVKKNFENAIKHTSGKYIFLADQDDIWKENKIDLIIEQFERNKDITLLVHDAQVFDDLSKKIIYNSFFEYRNSGAGIIKNIYKNTYIGCCMAFRNELKKFILPIPNNIGMHDQWIGEINEIKCGKTLFLKQSLILYRRHMDNVSKMKRSSWNIMLKNRINLILEIIKIKRR